MSGFIQGGEAPTRDYLPLEDRIKLLTPYNPARIILMKKIHLIRHVKSSWEDDSLADIDRPLNKRGIKTCRFMAQHILDAGCCFDYVFCSLAIRAQLTIDLINSSLEGLDIQWQTEEQLYTFDSDTIFDWCRTLDESISELVIIGHNPALTELANYIGDKPISNIPTAGVFCAELEIPSWAKISGRCGKLKFFEYPKKHA